MNERKGRRNKNYGNRNKRKKLKKSLKKLMEKYFNGIKGLSEEEKMQKKKCLFFVDNVE